MNKRGYSEHFSLDNPQIRELKSCSFIVFSDGIASRLFLYLIIHVSHFFFEQKLEGFFFGGIKFDLIRSGHTNTTHVARVISKIACIFFNFYVNKKCIRYYFIIVQKVTIKKMC